MIQPTNGYLLVREIPTPHYGQLTGAKIISSSYLFGNVLADGTDGPDWADKNVLFPKDIGIRLTMRNDQNEIETRYLVLAKAVIATLRV